MKKCVLVSSILCCLFEGCSRDDIRDFIPGTYIRTVINEFSVGRDTLVIRTTSTESYTIVHKGSYQRISQGKLLPVKSKAEIWLASYDEKQQVLEEVRKGKIISFEPSQNILLVGNSPYKKIK